MIFPCKLIFGSEMCNTTSYKDNMLIT
uniref:Uncharacterized protein n=1 Tax=Rhizophora mucronata TaxID=61149 RepID=A0A2P2M8T6_RHIMU